MSSSTGRTDLALVVPGETDYLYLIREFVTAVAHKMGFPAEHVGQIEIAVDEACANIIEHAYGSKSVPGRVIVARNMGAGAPAITLRVSAYSDRIEVRILDHGPDFAMNGLGELDLSEYVSGDRKRWMGTFIIRNFMDEVHHTYRPGEGNELVLVKYLSQ